MRILGAYIGGVLTGLACALAVLATLSPPPPMDPGAAGLTGGDPLAAGTEPVAGAGSPAMSEGSDALPGPDILATLLETKDLAGLRRELEHLLDSGESGYRVVLEFLRSQVESNEFALREGPLALTLLSVALRNEERAAGCSRFLLRHLDRVEDLPVRKALLGFLPALVACAGEAGPQIRRAFEETLLAGLERPEQLEPREKRTNHGAGAANGSPSGALESLQALDDLRVELTPEALEPILSDPSKAPLHPLILERLAGRDDGLALEAVKRHVARLEAGDTADLRNVFQALSRMKLSAARAFLEESISSPVRGVREAATLAFFSTRRGLDSLPLAGALLRSGAALREKATLLGEIRASSPEIFEALEVHLSSLPPDVSRAVQLAAFRGSGGPVRVGRAGEVGAATTGR